MIENNLFEFDKNIACHCEEGQSPDAAIQKENLGLLHFVRNDAIVIGTDEAGRGPGAGGVFASAVYFPNLNDELIEKLSKLNDSKKLSKKKREELYEIIIESTINSTVCVEVEEIEKINILNASLKAMRLACENVINLCSPLEGEPKSIDFEEGQIRQSRAGLLSHKQQNILTCKVGIPAHQEEIMVLVDGNKLIKDFYPSPKSQISILPQGEGKITQQCIIKGDSKSASIAAASILAKVSRDRYMDELHEKFPQYNWQKNAGYLTAEHLEAIEKYGITPHHRKSFLKGRNTEQLSLL